MFSVFHPHYGPRPALNQLLWGIVATGYMLRAPAEACRGSLSPPNTW